MNNMYPETMTETEQKEMAFERTLERSCVGLCVVAVMVAFYGVYLGEIGVTILGAIIVIGPAVYLTACAHDGPDYQEVTTNE